MKSLQSFLHPKRKENLKFTLGDSFLDEEGRPIEFEMRQLSIAEDRELCEHLKDETQKSPVDEIMAYVAESLVYPDLHDRELLEALGQRDGRVYLEPREALEALLNSAELGAVVQHYRVYNQVTDHLREKVEEVKN